MVIDILNQIYRLRTQMIQFNSLRSTDFANFMLLKYFSVYSENIESHGHSAMQANEANAAHLKLHTQLHQHGNKKPYEDLTN